MDSTYPVAKTKDFSAFEQALGQLHVNLLKDYVDDGHSIVIAMSRKGPKLVDAIFNKEEQERLNVITEFALPFICKKMKQGVVYHIYIVDDAVYYGSTLKNLVKEIREYEQICGLTLEVKAYVAIIDMEALSFNEIEVIGMPGPRNGYGHYFVQQVMSLFRSKNRCMEVEYPTITYRLDKTADLESLEKDLRESFEDVYRTSYKEEEVLNVLLKKDGSQFSKIRIYREGTRLHLTFMSPYNFASSDVYSKELVYSMGGAYREWWNNLTSCLVDKEQNKSLSETFSRNEEKSLVVMVNYLYSYQSFIYNRLEIEGILSRRGYKLESHGINSEDIYRLIGRKNLADELAQLLAYYDRLVEFKRPDMYSHVVTSEHQVYEEYDSPTIEERRTLESHNEHMIRNSRTYQEALSAIVFNQNLFVERWSRHGMQAPSRHLWFGYSHDVLLQLLNRYSRLHEEPSEVMIHEWLDTRVDMGCVVPQYIIDHVSGHWVRVFRPGENEEIVLSHLARYVLFVYRLINQKLKLGFVPREVLDQMLVVLHKQLWNDFLSNQFSFKLQEQQRELVLVEPEWEGNPMSVVRYLRKMYVLDENNGEVTIAPRISDPEFLTNTTLDDRTTSLIEQIVGTVMDRYQEMDVKYSDSESFFNYYLHHDVKPEYLLDYSKGIAQRLYEVAEKVNLAMHYDREKIADEKMEDELIECFNDIMEYNLFPDFYLEGIKDDKEFKERCESDLNIKAQNNFKILLQIINLMVGLYALDNIEDVLSYLRSETTLKAMGLLRLGSLKKYLEDLDELNPNKIRRDSKLLNLQVDILTKIIND